MKTIKDVSKVYRKEIGRAIYPGVPYSKYKTRSSKAFKTGNLLTQILKSPQNDINRLGSKVKGGYQFVVDIAPNGADYGRWVHYGTRKMGERPYAEIAANSKEFNNALGELIGEDVDFLVQTLFTAFDNEMGKAGFKVS
jgi:hypothetical protein